MRPLVCHDPIRRLLTRTLLAEDQQSINAHLGPHQFAVGKSGGCAAMAASVLKLSEKYPEEKPSTG